MITVEELINLNIDLHRTRNESIALAKENAGNIKLSEYYVHLATVAEHQIDLMHRIIRLAESNAMRQKRSK